VDIPDVRVFHTEITNPRENQPHTVAYLFRQHTTNSAFILPPHGDLLTCVDRGGTERRPERPKHPMRQIRSSSRFRLLS
jgi:hypothetical protein